MKSIILTTLFLLQLVAGSLARADNIGIDNLWVREAPPGMKILAAYLTIHNHGADDDMLVSVDSPCFSSIEMHESLLEDGKATMIQHKHIQLPGRGKVDLRPGGMHLMLFDPLVTCKNDLREGGNIEMNFTFSSGKRIAGKAIVKKATGSNHQHHHH